MTTIKQISLLSIYLLYLISGTQMVLAAPEPDAVSVLPSATINGITFYPLTNNRIVPTSYNCTTNAAGNKTCAPYVRSYLAKGGQDVARTDTYQVSAYFLDNAACSPTTTTTTTYTLTNNTNYSTDNQGNTFYINVYYDMICDPSVNPYAVTIKKSLYDYYVNGEAVSYTPPSLNNYTTYSTDGKFYYNIKTTYDCQCINKNSCYPSQFAQTKNYGLKIYYDNTFTKSYMSGKATCTYNTSNPVCETYSGYLAYSLGQLKSSTAENSNSFCHYAYYPPSYPRCSAECFVNGVASPFQKCKDAYYNNGKTISITSNSKSSTNQYNVSDYNNLVSGVKYTNLPEPANYYCGNATNDICYKNGLAQQSMSVCNDAYKNRITTDGNNITVNLLGTGSSAEGYKNYTPPS